ncbi:hypothetical protein L9F63_027786, partial [Diploptera punctata]
CVYRMSEAEVVKRLRGVLERIQIACQRRPLELPKIQPRLVAVSKTKPKELIIAAYEAGHRNFGENYVQELVDKSHDSEILERCKDIKWHYIGHLQRNKVNKVVAVPGIFLVETVDSDKLATTLDTAWAKQVEHKGRLKVMLQVNTSAEEEKNGCPPESAVELAKHIRERCNNLELVGLMTIGSLCLKKVRDSVCDALGLDCSALELSMGMSDDFEHAIEMGSTNVRVGSSIFGHRTKK